jgi:hypothetical protein
MTIARSTIAIACAATIYRHPFVVKHPGRVTHSTQTVFLLFSLLAIGFP